MGALANVIRRAEWCMSHHLPNDITDSSGSITSGSCPLLVNTCRRLLYQSRNNHPYNLDLRPKAPHVQYHAEGLPHIGSEAACATGGWTNSYQSVWFQHSENSVPASERVRVDSHKS